MSSTVASLRHVTEEKSQLPPEEVLFGSTREMREIRDCLRRMAATNVAILLQGESGTGKELLARYIHEYSPCRGGAFVKVNCPAIPGTLFESELFGYQRGAFTGAYTSKPGRVEMAHRGTLFLDEIAELELGMQAKLLQLLQDGQFSRIGSQGEQQLDVRVICATNRNLEEEIRSGNFRQDLFFRVNVASLELPPLRDRSEDIPLLTEYFLARYTREFERSAALSSTQLATILGKHHWPGNIRELENAIKRFVILGPEATFQKIFKGDNEPQAEIPAPRSSISLKQITREAVRQVEKRVILSTLEATHWNRRAVSRELGISYAALLYKMREAGIPARRLHADSEFAERAVESKKSRKAVLG